MRHGMKEAGRDAFAWSLELLSPAARQRQTGSSRVSGLSSPTNFVGLARSANGIRTRFAMGQDGSGRRHYERFVVAALLTSASGGVLSQVLTQEGEKVARCAQSGWRRLREAWPPCHEWPASDRSR